MKNLEAKLVLREIQSEKLEQYGRRNNIEIAGIDSSVSTVDLAATAADILKTSQY